MTPHRTKTWFQSGRLVVVAILCASFVAPMKAAPLPNLLDDNRNDTALSVLESALFSAAALTLGFNVNPFVASYLPVTFSGRVLSHPKIHNIYLDDDWDQHNPGAPTVAQIDGFTRALASSHYLDSAAQYGVHQAEFTGSHGRSILCAPIQPEFGHAEFVELLAWITCEVSFSPPIPGLIPPLTGVPQTNDDTLYVVYLPPSMDIVDGSCDSLSAFHFFGAAPNFKFDSVLGVPIPVFYSQTFAYAVVPTRCASGTPQQMLDHITEAASHEIVEAAVDPIVGTGWINNSVVTNLHGGFFSEILGTFSNIALDLKVGEVADICEQGVGNTGAPAFQHPSPPVALPVDAPALDNRILVAPYWSIEDAQAHVGDPAFNPCVPILPKSTLTFGKPSAGTFVTSGTEITIDATDGGTGTGIASISYRSYPQGSVPPDFSSASAPVHFALSGSDGPFVIDFFASGNNGLAEGPRTALAILDNSVPVTTITSPEPREYLHTDVLTLGFSTTDGAGSGVAAASASLDGATSVAGHGLASGQVIPLLTELAVGPHSFSVDSLDRVANHGIASVAFSIIVSADSIREDVNVFRAAGLITNDGVAAALLAQLSAAADARTRGQCATASRQYLSFVHDLEAQSGKGVDATASAIMIADAQYLIAHCP